MPALLLPTARQRWAPRCSAGTIACAKVVALVRSRTSPNQRHARKLRAHDEVGDVVSDVVGRSVVGLYYLGSRDLDRIEQPLLLHPYRDNPAEHLIFGRRGAISARDGSDRGEWTIRVFNLASDSLARARDAAAMSELWLCPTQEKIIERINFLTRGEVTFSAARIAALERELGQDKE
jgi:hypothetical protein